MSAGELLAVIIMPTDQLVFIRMRLLLDRIIDDEHPSGLLGLADQRLDLLPQHTAI